MYVFIYIFILYAFLNGWSFYWIILIFYIFIFSLWRVIVSRHWLVIFKLYFLLNLCVRWSISRVCFRIYLIRNLGWLHGVMRLVGVSFCYLFRVIFRGFLLCFIMIIVNMQISPWLIDKYVWAHGKVSFSFEGLWN